MWGKVIKQQKQQTKMINLLAEITGVMNFHVAFAALGAAIGIGILGAKASEATGRNPSAAGNILTLAIILAALIEGIVFFAIFLVPQA